jgi:radical SAM superfamily enzyme YgiQ (UPF0313 family)
MDHAYKYLTPDHENLVLCNGEGERTFSDYLQELLTCRPDFAKVRGLSFYSDGQLVTTEKNERIKDLNEIPSPFLTGLFDRNYGMATIETNRGCPFSCAFCFWGAATNSKVFTFNDERIREELTWLSNHDCVCIYIADANWGIYPRDVAFSEHIAELSRMNKMPNIVYYSAAKNRPERITQITEIFTNAGITTSQPVSLQTMNETSLEMIDRKNIRLSSYIELQNRLNEKKIGSFTELIWPLPGETLSSFKEGIDKLCAAKADTIIVYPQLLLHNTTLYKCKEKFEFVTKEIDGEIGEVELVVQTANVSAEEFQDGIRIFYAMHLLHNIRSLYITGGYLKKNRQIKNSDIFSAFVMFCKQRKNNFVSRFCEKSIEEYGYYDVFNYGKLAHYSLHDNRKEFDELLCQFASSQEWWDDDEAQAMFEIDLINKPYVYSNTAIEESYRHFRHLKIQGMARRGYVVEVPEKYLPSFRELVDPKEVPSRRGNRFLIDHKRMQYPFMKLRGLDHNAGYCHGMINRIEDIMPIWSSQ